MAELDRGSLSQLTRSPGYADAILQISVRLVEATDKATVLELLRQVVVALGVDAAFYTSCFGDDDTHKSYRSLVCCDPLWEAQYACNRWYLDDPWLHYAMRHTMPARTEEIAVRTDAQRWVVEAAAHFGFASAMVVPVPAPPLRARTGALCLGSERPRFFQDDGYPVFRMLARMIAMELGDWQLRVVRDELIRRARINESDLELLRHEQQGHSSKVIAEALHMEANSIDSRFHRLTLRLGATNRRSAVRIAEIHGLL